MRGLRLGDRLDRPAFSAKGRARRLWRGPWAQRQGGHLSSRLLRRYLVSVSKRHSGVWQRLGRHSADRIPGNAKNGPLFETGGQSSDCRLPQIHGPRDFGCLGKEGVYRLEKRLLPTSQPISKVGSPMCILIWDRRSRLPAVSIHRVPARDATSGIDGVASPRRSRDNFISSASRCRMHILPSSYGEDLSLEERVSEVEP